MAWNIAQTPFPQLGHGAIQIGLNDSTTSQVSQKYTGITAQIVLPRAAWMVFRKFCDEFQKGGGRLAPHAAIYSNERSCSENPGAAAPVART
jgi:hypothetical protein